MKGDTIDTATSTIRKDQPFNKIKKGVPARKTITVSSTLTQMAEDSEDLAIFRGTCLGSQYGIRYNPTLK